MCLENIIEIGILKIESHFNCFGTLRRENFFTRNSAFLMILQSITLQLNAIQEVIQPHFFSLKTYDFHLYFSPYFSILKL